MRSDEQAIREVHSTWIDAVNAGDLARLLVMTTDDVVFLNPGEECHRPGWVLRQVLCRSPAASDPLRQRAEGGRDRRRGCLHAEPGLAHPCTPRAGGEESRLAGDRMTIYRKQPDGRWLLARDANVLSPVRDDRSEGEAPAREVCFMTANDFRELPHAIQRIPGRPHARRPGT